VERHLDNQGKPGNVDVRNYALYQQTIKTVLSEEAYARYQAAQAERISYRQKAVRDLVLAALDTCLLLSDEQRGKIETSLPAVPLPKTRIMNGYFVFGRFLASPEFEKDDLIEWQREKHNERLREIEEAMPFPA
jgi:hypothetical protein